MAAREGREIAVVARPAPAGETRQAGTGKAAGEMSLGAAGMMEQCKNHTCMRIREVWD